MRIIKKDKITPPPAPGIASPVEVVEVRPPIIRDRQRREALRTALERNLLRREVQRLQRRVEELEQRLETSETSLAAERDEAHAAGLSAGIDQGINQGQAEAEELISSLRDLFEEARLQRQELVTNTGTQVVELAIGMARRLVGEVFRLDSALLIGVIDKLLEEYANAGPFSIALHPDDLALFKQKGYPERLQAVQAELVEAPEVPRHQCRVEMAQGLVELGEEQLDVIRKAMIEQLEVNGGE